MLVNNDIKIYNGTDEITKVYNGTNVVYEKETPAPYTELNYLESTGTQYINTGINPAINVIIELQFQYTSNTTNNKTRLFGSRLTWNSRGYYAGTGSNSETGNFWCQLSSIYATINVRADKNIHTIRFGNSQVYLDGTYKTTLSGSNFEPYAPIHLFGAYDGDVSTTQATPGVYKMYYCKLYIVNNNVETLVADYIPVLDSNNVPCLYDKVSETYFYNQGSGTFLYG